MSAKIKNAKHLRRRIGTGDRDELTWLKYYTIVRSDGTEITHADRIEALLEREARRRQRCITRRR